MEKDFITLNTCLISYCCCNDECTEPTKKVTGHDFYAPEAAKNGSERYNIYTCDKFKNGECNGQNNS